MQKLAAVLLAASLLGGLTACSIERSATASRAQTSMVGMAKEDVLICMGAPASKETVGATEVWTYQSGGDSNVTAVTGGGSVAVTGANVRRRYCVVNVVMRDDRVRQVNYSGRTGGLLTSGEQCAFAVQNCAQ